MHYIVRGKSKGNKIIQLYNVWAAKNIFNVTLELELIIQGHNIAGDMKIRYGN